MKYLFKINSRYDGHRPAVIEERLDPRGWMRLGWARYIETVEEGDEVWVYFRGPHRFEDGIYVKGEVREVDVGGQVVWLDPVEYSTDEPLSGPEATEHAHAAVAMPYRQVFLLPEELLRASCDINGEAQSCKRRDCGDCPTWRSLARTDPDALRRPHRLSRAIEAFSPAYWAIPPRSFVYMGGRTPAAAIRLTSELFYRFKTGTAELAYPLALGIKCALEDRGLDAFDAIVPIPLSPEKERRGEIHRTRLLATELSNLLEAPVREALRLRRPVSKHQLKVVEGMGDADFEDAYCDACAVAERGPFGRVLLVDDVCTEGSTLAAGARVLRGEDETCEIVTATAAQMAVRDAVADETKLLEA